MDTPLNSDKRLRARLALTNEADIASWQEKEAQLEKRKDEAAKAMASDEQKKIQNEKEKTKLHKEASQKKLAELEAIKKAEDDLKRKDFSTKQQEKDTAQEKLRQTKIKQILESQKAIEGIKRAPENQLSSIHTLTDDLSEAIKEKGLTASRLAQTNEPFLTEEEKTISWRKTIVFALSFILFFGGLTTISWSLWQKNTQSLAPTQLAHNSIVFADEHVAIDLKNKPIDQIKQEITLALAPGETTNSTREKIKDVYFTYEESRVTNQGLVIERKIADPTTFASSTGLAITDDLLRFLKSDFMLGVYLGPQTEPFYIFKTDSYKNSADALLHNENDVISQLLSPFVGAETAAKIKLNIFQDKMFKNRDTRIVIDQDNATLAIYTWLDKNTIAVAPNEFVLEKVLNSFLTPKPVVK